MDDAFVDSSSESESDSDLEEEDMIAQCSVAIVSSVLWYSSRFIKNPLHTSVLSGQQWLEELLAGHNMRFYNELGMNKFVFERFPRILKRGRSLSSKMKPNSPTTNSMKLSTSSWPIAISQGHTPL